MLKLKQIRALDPEWPVLFEDCASVAAEEGRFEDADAICKQLERDLEATGRDRFRARRGEHRALSLYHLTLPELADPIQAQGLLAGEDGWIYLFTDMLVAGTIAKSQVGVDRYVVFQIALEGVTVQLRRDAVAELSVGYQRRVRQPLIEPQHLRLLGVFDVVEGPTEWDYLVEARLTPQRRRARTRRRRARRKG